MSGHTKSILTTTGGVILFGSIDPLVSRVHESYKLPIGSLYVYTAVTGPLLYQKVGTGEVGSENWAEVGGGTGSDAWSASGGVVSLTTATNKLGVGSSVDPNMGGSSMWISDWRSLTNAILYVESLQSGLTMSDSSMLHMNCSSSFDTTAGAVQSVGLRIIHDPGRAAGAEPLTNIGLLIDTNNGDFNEAIRVTHGTVRFDEQVLTGPLTTDGALAQSGGACTIAGTAGSSIVLTGAGGNISCSGQLTSGDQANIGGNCRIAGNTFWFANAATNNFLYCDKAGTSGDQSLELMSAGTLPVRVNANTQAVGNAGTGGLEVYEGGGSGNVVFAASSSGVTTADVNHGFYGVAAVARQTVTGSKASGAAWESLLAAMVALGFVIDGTSA